MDADAFFDALAAVPNFRTAAFSDLEMVPRGKGFRFQGHAAVFDEPALIDTIPGIGKLTEEVRSGSFRTVLALGANVPLTLEHDPKVVYATTRSGRLKLTEDTKGLAVDANLPDTSAVRDLKANVDADIVRGMSFGFVAGAGNQQIERRPSGRHRILTGFKKLLDVCATWDPTYPSAEAQFRSMTMTLADSAESVQQLLMGAYPQLQAQGTEEEGTEETDPPADEPPPDGEPPDDGTSDDAGAAEQRSVTAAQRRLQLLIYELGGDERVNPS
jgi:HK97 family phage prohead protease